MALTPDDVVTKEFQHVRFKEGLDSVEVDDFLDEIVVEWRKVIDENVQLKAKIEELEKAKAAAPAAAAPLSADPAKVSQSAGIIELAQRVHDEHVAEGKAQRDQLIAEAKRQASQMVSSAEEEVRVHKSELEKELEKLNSKRETLLAFEREYRNHLRGYFQEKLKELDSESISSAK